MEKTILIVDDEPDIREILCFNLEQAGYRCLQASDGRQALERLTVNSEQLTVNNEQLTVDLILLDVMMPGMSGYEVARSIRNDEVAGVPYDLPIIFLTALGEEDDVLRGFKLGADDYISKPFSIKEVIARISAVLKRTHTHPLPSEGKGWHIEQQAGLSFDDKLFSAAIDGTDLSLTKMEYELLHFLVTHAGVVYSRSDLLTQVWPDNGLVLERTVDVTITRLRKKIGSYKDRIKTKTGYGYYWEK